MIIIDEIKRIQKLNCFVIIAFSFISIMKNRNMHLFAMMRKINRLKKSLLHFKTNLINKKKIKLLSKYD